MVHGITAQVETLLRKYEPTNETQKEPIVEATTDVAVDANPGPDGPVSTYGTTTFSPSGQNYGSDNHQTQVHFAPADASGEQSSGCILSHSFSREMVELGLEEPLPLQEVLEDLTQIYFVNIHPTVPIIHQYRFLAALNLSPNTRPPIALRYAMWTLAASVANRYQDLHGHFYARARKYAELAEMTGYGEKVASTAHTQAWILLGLYELKMMYFPRAWLSTGRAVRLAQMMGMHRLDGHGYNLKQILSPPRDWVEKEERRRTFWMAFCLDRYATVGTGWPMAIEEQDIHTHLPCSEGAYERCEEGTAMSLEDALRPSNAARLSPFAGVLVVAALFGRVLLHLHRPSDDNLDDEINGDFWKCHREMDNMLLSTALHLPAHLRLPAIVPQPNTVYLHLNLHASSICLHQAAISKADKNQLSSDLIMESSVRCFTAAAEITRIMRMIAHTDLATMNPFLPFCVFVAARVFINHVKRRPNDHEAISSVQFLLSAMTVLQTMNPLAASFLVHLDVELEGTGLEAHPDDARYHPRFPKGSAGLQKDEIDGFSVFKTASPRVETVGQSEASPNPAEAAPPNPLDPGVSATSPLPKPPDSDEFINREVPQYQCLPVRTAVGANHGMSAHHESQTKPNLGLDPSSRLPVYGVDAIISGSSSEMDMTRDGTAQFGDAAVHLHTSASIHPSSRREKLSACALPDYTSRSQSYTSQTAGLEELGYVSEETWDFNDMTIPDDLYDSMMNVGRTGS